MSNEKNRIASVAWIVGTLGVSGCALQSYDPRPIDPQQTRAQLLDRNPDDPALRDALAAQGVDTSRWPLRSWDLAALTALACELRVDLAQLRAERRVADAARDTAAARRNPGLDLVAEHHGDRGSNGSPWTVGLVIDLALTGSSRRSARLAIADSQLRESDWAVAERAWQVRAEVRDAHAAWLAAERTRNGLAGELKLRQDESQLLEKRLVVGAVSSAEPARARVREAESRRELVAAEQAAARARVELARATGLPAETLIRLPLDPAARATSPVAPPDALQHAALNDRLDIRRALERYAATEARLQLEIARQIPEFSIKPGYAWDQGDNRWSLGLAALLPLFDRNEGPIAEARARRDAEAARFIALQSAAIARLDLATTAARAAEAMLQTAQASLTREQELAARVARRFEAGDADRLEQLNARLAVAASARRAAEAEYARQRAFAELEDAIQRPLGSIPAARTPDAALARHDADTP